MKIIERISIYLKDKGIKDAEAERNWGLSNGYLGKQRSRNADLGESIIVKIVENCPDITIEWLFTGKESSKEERLQEPTSATGNDLFLKLYQEEKKEKEELMRKIGALEERIKQYEENGLDKSWLSVPIVPRAEEPVIESVPKERKTNRRTTKSS